MARTISANSKTLPLEFSNEFPAKMRRTLSQKTGSWLAVWGTSLQGCIGVSLNPRLKTTLASCTPQTGTIRLNPALMDSQREILPEVLCHELAHIVVFQTHGPDEKPHGPRWHELMSLAGFEPRTAIANTHPRQQPLKSNIARIVYRHTCPVCHATRTSVRPQPRWRCAACVEAGLDGKMNIESYPRKGSTRS
jgi:predicted SprT family Zn-dependent metalloprotease